MLGASWLGSALLFAPSGVLAATGEQLKALEIEKPRILVFDVIETMLDLNALRPHFEQVFGSSSALDEWFSLLLQYSMVVTQADAYYSFGEIAGAALEMLASTKRVQLSPENKARILGGMLTLPAHPDVLESLERLRSAGFRMVTLTNSNPAAVQAQLQHAQIAKYFEASITVNSMRRFKPDLLVYRSAAAHLHAEPGELLLIAAHAWDVFGAKRAGWRTAFVAREGKTLFPLGEKPDIVAPDMKAVAGALLS